MRTSLRSGIRARGRIAPRTVLAAAAALLLLSGCQDRPQSTGTGELLQGPKQGRWHAVRTNRFDPTLTDEQRAEVEKLEGLGYLGHVHEASDLAGVVRHDPERAWRGLNLVTSGHGPEAVLLDMDGNEIHRWRRSFSDVWPDSPYDDKDLTFWRRTHLFENGDLLAIFEGRGIIRVDKDSEVLWAGTVRAHHDIALAPDGNILVLSRVAHMIKRLNKRTPILEDFVSTLDPDTGEEIDRFSVLKAVQDAAVPLDWRPRAKIGGDLLHTNSLEILDGRIADRVPEFAAGNLLVSFLFLDRIAVIDPAQGKVIWALGGDYRMQHDPQVLENGNLLLFDNQGRADSSSVQEIDPATGDVVWEYRGTEREPFYSLTCGIAQRLPNGNTLITESDYGRAFEVTTEGETVWEYYNPHRAGEDDRYIATLMEVQRLPVEVPPDWAKGSAAADPGAAPDSSSGDGQSDPSPEPEPGEPTDE